MWIGVRLRLLANGVTCTISEEQLKSLLEACTKALSLNVVSKRDLASIAGKANHIASLLWSWRPFLQGLWAALTTTGGDCPNNCVWTKQVRSSLKWLCAFIRGQRGTLERTFYLDAHYNRVPPVELILDASPWGLGGGLIVGNVPTDWFSSELTEYDFKLFQWDKGSPNGQQTWESLCALVALRLWAHKWHNTRIKLIISGDSVSMLTMVLHMKVSSQSASMGIVARELALDVAELTYCPDVASHIPGVANCLADTLSRRYAPKYAASWSCPSVLCNVPESEVKPRCPEYFRTLRFTDRTKWG